MISGKISAHFGVEVLVRTGSGELSRLRVSRNSGHVVGDFVEVLSDRLKRLPRKNELKRQTPFGEQVLAANLTHVGLVLSPTPKTPEYFVDQAIVACRAEHIEPFLIVTKLDLPDSALLLSQLQNRYSKSIPVLAGFDELHTFIRKPTRSSLRGAEGDAAIHGGLLRSARNDEIVTLILVGVSGAGKSTLINQLIPKANQKTGSLSEHRKTGKHTTSGALMLELPDGGELIDSPGIRDFTPVDLNSSDLAYYFPGFEPFRNQPCKFRDCKHHTEPGCIVREQADPDDYMRYLNLSKSH